MQIILDYILNSSIQCIAASNLHWNLSMDVMEMC